MMTPVEIARARCKMRLRTASSHAVQSVEPAGQTTWFKCAAKVGENNAGGEESSEMCQSYHHHHLPPLLTPSIAPIPRCGHSDHRHRLRRHRQRPLRSPKRIPASSTPHPRRRPNHRLPLLLRPPLSHNATNHPQSTSNPTSSPNPARPHHTTPPTHPLPLPSSPTPNSMPPVSTPWPAWAKKT